MVPKVELVVKDSYRGQFQGFHRKTLSVVAILHPTGLQGTMVPYESRAVQIGHHIGS